MHTPKTALITGASSGIGAAFAHQLAVQQYDLILVARRVERLTSLATALHQQFHVNAEVLTADLSNPVDIERVEKRLADSDKLTVLVNNAGFGIPGNFAEMLIDQQLAMI